MLIIQCHNKGGYNLAYKKVYLVEMLDVRLYNTIFGNYILEKLKLSSNDLWIFILGLLIIVRTVSTYTELWLSLNKVGSPTRSDTHRIAYRQ